MLPKVISITKPDSTNHGIVKELLTYEPNITSNNYFRVLARIDPSKIGNAFDNSTQTTFQSVLPNSEPDSSELYLTLDFKYHRLSLSGVQIFCIYSPYIVAFSMYGSNDGEKWELIKPFSDLGMQLYANRVFFSIEPYSKFYRFIKYRHDLGMNYDTKDENHRAFAM